MNNETQQQLEELKTAYKKDVENELKHIKDYYNNKNEECETNSKSGKYHGLIRDKNAALPKRWYELNDQFTDDVSELMEMD